MLRLLHLKFVVSAGCCVALGWQIGETLFLFWCLSSAIGLVLDVLDHVFISTRHRLLAKLLQVLVHVIPWVDLTCLILHDMHLVTSRTTLKFVKCG